MHPTQREHDPVGLSSACMDYVGMGGVVVAVVVGVVAIRVAVKQLRLPRDLERARVFDAIKRYLNAVSQLGDAPADVLSHFYEMTEDKRVNVLFRRRDAREYILLARTKANDLRTLAALKESFPPSPEESSVGMKWRRLVQWMEEQRSSELEKRLGRYM